MQMEGLTKMENWLKMGDIKRIFQDNKRKKLLRASTPFCFQEKILGLSFQLYFLFSCQTQYWKKSQKSSFFHEQPGKSNSMIFQKQSLNSHFSFIRIKE